MVSGTTTIAIIGIVIGLIGAGTSIYFGIENQSLKKQINIINNNQQGGTSIGNIENLNLGPTKRVLTQEDSLKLESTLNQIGAKGVNIVAFSGNAEANQYAIQIKNYLEKKGWSVSEVGSIMMKYFEGASIQPQLDEKEFAMIVVGAKSVD